MKIKGGCFKTMNLNQNLLLNIPFKSPTAIQRKTIPALLTGQNIIGIARTGSGKTLAYLIPAIQLILQKKKVLVLVPTRELIYQTVNFLRGLTKGMRVNIAVLHGGKEEKPLNNPDIIIGTIGRVRYTQLPKIDFFVVDEVDRIFEEQSFKEDFLAIEESLDKSRLNAYFSATLPDSIIHLISEYTLIKLEEVLNPNLDHNFIYVPYTEKDAALLYFISSISEKTIIFTKTKYSVEFLAELLKNYSPSTIYSSMDQENRQINLNKFIKGINNLLIVTDLAARGLDIPHLNVIINFDLCDTKTFLHRIGRVGRQDVRGRQISLITFKDVYNYYKIKEKYSIKEELGSIPIDILDQFHSETNKKELLDLKISAENAEVKANKFAKNEELENNYKSELENLKLHPMFIKDTERERLILEIKNKINPKKEVFVQKEGKVYRSDRFIPYRKESFINNEILKDDFEKKVVSKKKKYTSKKRN